MQFAQRPNAICKREQRPSAICKREQRPSAICKREQRRSANCKKLSYTPTRARCNLRAICERQCNLQTRAAAECNVQTRPTAACNLQTGLLPTPWSLSSLSHVVPMIGFRGAHKRTRNRASARPTPKGAREGLLQPKNVLGSFRFRKKCGGAVFTSLAPRETRKHAKGNTMAQDDLSK